MSIPSPIDPQHPALQAHTLTDLLRAQAAQRPAAPALRSVGAHSPGDPWACLSYAALAAVAHAIAQQLAGRVQRGDRVAWLGLNHPAQLALLFALDQLDAVLVPLNHRLSPTEWQAVLHDCSPRLVVHDDGFASATQALLHSSGAHWFCWPVQALAQPAANPPAHHRAEHPARQQPVLLVYTSGTTGQPKGAVHTRGNLLSNMAMAAQVQGMQTTDRVLTVLPLFHVGGLCIQTLPALSVGAEVLLASRFDAAATLACIAHDRPSLSLQVPATLQALTRHPAWVNTDLSSLRAIWAGSSLLPPEPLQAFMARGVPVCNVYGSTETGPFSIALPPEQAHSHLGSCGWPAPGVAVRLCDPQGNAVPVGTVGELWLRAPNVVQHYWPKQPALDAEGFFHTGDLAQQAPDGSFTVVGRAKDMLISGGENIYPAEIENLLLQHPDVLECAVLGQPDPQWGETVVAVVVLKASDDSEAMPDWQPFLNGRLARYKWPRRWVRSSGLPRTALGKVHKAALQASLQAALQASP
ncbi:MAG: hypothetical protein RLZZ352_2239 [Pseudomonadota bacterium]|jgi:fatty-acyl-CoA synthase